MKRLICALLACALLALCACRTRATPTPGDTATPPAVTQTPTAEQTGTPALEELRMEDATMSLPEKLAGNEGEPMLSVYVLDTQTIEQMGIETYLEAVLAGEMRNDWPMEALKAQAILARTFVLKFISEKESLYPGAMISTDIKEAQAYDAQGVNERIREAIEATRGVVMVHGDSFPFSWFHAHAGGITELAKPGLEYEKDEPGYTQIVESPDSDNAPDDVKEWTVAFSVAQVLEALSKMGVAVDTLTGISIAEHAPSGRALTLSINSGAHVVSAPSFRLALDSLTLKSTLISSIQVSGENVTFQGRGYGHGVGMSQWGAYGMAENGQSATEIVNYYFKDIHLEKLWP